MTSKWKYEMKQRLIYVLCVTCLMLASMDARAEAGWTDYVRVSELTPSTHQRFTVKLMVPKNPSGCKNKDWFYLDYDATGADQMFRVLLEALASGKKVRVYVTGRCELNGYSEISSVGIVP